MEVITIRLAESTVEALDEEGPEHGFESRTAFLRHLVDHRDAILEDAPAYSDENTVAQLDAMSEEIDSLRATIESLEGATPGPIEPQSPQMPGDAPAARVDGVEDLDLPGTGGVEQRRHEAVEAVYDRLRELGTATKQELLEVVDADAVGYQDVESFWSNVIGGRGTLSRLPGVEPPSTGGRTWRYVAD